MLHVNYVVLHPFKKKSNISLQQIRKQQHAAISKIKCPVTLAGAAKTKNVQANVLHGERLKFIELNEADAFVPFSWA
jgi:hypothetical protein